MSTIDNGGAAFPVVPPNEMGVQYFGLSVRDYFAAAAISGVIEACKGDTMHGISQEQHFAKNSYAIADAMIAARGEA